MLHVTEAGSGSGDLNSSDQGSVPRPPPIRGQYSDHVTSTDQSEASTLESSPSLASSSKPKMKKPPRKSKLSEEKSVKNLTLESGSGENCDDKNNEGESPAINSSAGRIMMTAMMSKLNNHHPSSIKEQTL